MMDASGALDWAARMQARRPIMWLGFMTVPGGWWGAAGRLSGAVPQLAGAGADTTRDHPQNSPREKSQKSGLCSPRCWPRRRAYPRGRSAMSSDLTQGRGACLPSGWGPSVAAQASGRGEDGFRRPRNRHLLPIAESGRFGNRTAGTAQICCSARRSANGREPSPASHKAVLIMPCGAEGGPGDLRVGMQSKWAGRAVTACGGGGTGPMAQRR
jgi:hypothetical protein